MKEFAFYSLFRSVVKKNPKPKDNGDDAENDNEGEKTVLEQFASHETRADDSMLPKWLYKYLVFRYNLLDRTGNYRFHTLECDRSFRKKIA